MLGFAQNPCEFVSITRPSCTETSIRLDNTAFFNFNPNDGHIYSWVLGTTVNNDLFQSSDEDFNLPLTPLGITTVDSIDVTLTVTNTLGQTCITRDTFVWEVVTVVLGTEIFSWNQLQQNSGTLPVDFLSFDATMADHMVQLEWQTAFEDNNDGFEVQKSQNKQDWASIDFVIAKDNNEVNSYNYLDRQPHEGVNYYRLKQLDFDGAYEYSKIIAINNNKLNKKSTAAVYPNPSQGLINITAADGIDYIEIIDPLGRIINQYTTATTGNNLQIKLDSKGLYIVRTRSGDLIQSQKVLIQQ